MADIPIKITRRDNISTVICCIENEEMTTLDDEVKMPLHTLIWNRSEFVRFSLEDIIRIEADGSYSTVHLKTQESIMISYPLSVIQKSLPSQHFIRIHRSMIVNIAHITHLTGNSFRICGKLYTIGREYRKSAKSRFVFLGVKRVKL